MNSIRKRARFFLGVLTALVAGTGLAASGWTPVTPPGYQLDTAYLTFSGIAEEYLRALEMGNNRIVVAGSHGTLAFSDDQGRSWTPATVSDSLRNAVVFDVVYANGTWVAVTGPEGRATLGKKQKGRVLALRSVDGAAWQVNSEVLHGGQHALRKLAADGVGGWVATVAAEGRLIVSTDDGVTWATIAAAPVDVKMTAVAFLGGSWYAAGRRDIAPGTSTLYRSTDRGATWTIAHQFPHTVDALAVANNRLFAVGDRSAISSTANGAAWTQHHIALDGSTISLQDVVWTPPDGYIAAGENGVILHSKNLLVWQTTALPLPQFIFDLLRVGNDIFASTSTQLIYRGRP